MTRANVEGIAGKVLRGERLARHEAIALYRHASTHRLGRLADAVRARKHSDGVVTYIVDRNVNYTNVCVARCNFCAFYREVGAADGYVLGFDEIFAKIDETIALGGVQLLLQGGHNPDLPLTWYEDLFRAVKARYPSFKLHALSPPEVVHLSRLSQLPGAGGARAADRGRAGQHSRRRSRDPRGPRPAVAELLLEGDDGGVAGMSCARPTSWACAPPPTMMYGSVEHLEERVDHLLRLRELQDETGGFTAFITWSYQPPNTALGGEEATGIDYLRTLALARLVLDNFDNLQASWVTQGGKVGQLSLAFGANDMGSVMIEGERRPRGRRRLLHGRGRDRAQRGGRRVRAQAPQHALRDPRRPVLPPAGSAPLPRARRGARGR